MSCLHTLGPRHKIVYILEHYIYITFKIIYIYIYTYWVCSHMLKQQSTKSIQAQVLYFTQDMSYFNLDTMILGARRPPRLCKSVYLNPSISVYIYIHISSTNPIQFASATNQSTKTYRFGWPFLYFDHSKAPWCIWNHAKRTYHDQFKHIYVNCFQLLPCWSVWRANFMNLGQQSRGKMEGHRSSWFDWTPRTFGVLDWAAVESE